MSTLGIDIGSSQVKAVAFSDNGTQLASARQSYQYTTPRPGWMELDGRTVLKAAFQVIAECAASVAQTDPVLALAASSQGEAFSPLDRNGDILAAAMMHSDLRASRLIAEFTEDFGRERIYRLTGHTPAAMFSLGKLLYLQKYQPELMAKADKFLCFEDLLVHALTGRAVIGWPLAARTLLFDVTRHQWSPELLDAANLRPEQFSLPQASGTPVGPLKPDVARQLGLPTTVQVVSGGHDQIIGAYGCGATRAGSAMYAAGSVQCFVPVFDKPLFSDELCRNNLCTYDAAEPGKCASVAYSLTGSNLLDYFMRTYAADLHDNFEALLAEMPPEPTALLTLPYFTPSGTPYFDETTPACLFGWRIDTSRGTLLKGLQEGIALEMKLNYTLMARSGLRLDQLIATGGGFRNHNLVQLHADVLNLPISLVGNLECGCRGAASLARRALTGSPLPPPPIIAQVTPNPDQARAYDGKYHKYLAFSKLMREQAPSLL